MEISNIKIGILVIVGVIVISAVAMVGSYFTPKDSEAEGFRLDDFEFQIGDTWQYRSTTENGLVVLWDLEKEQLTSAIIGGRSCEAYLIQGTGAYENFGSGGVTLSQLGITVTSGAINFTRYEEKSGFSMKHVDNIVLDVEYQENNHKIEVIRTYELTSSKRPDVIKVGDSWSATETKVYNITETFMGTPVEENTESTSTVNYQITEFENISVPAGTYHCFGLQKTSEDGKTMYLAYYSLEIHRLVKYFNYHNGRVVDTWELVAYTGS